jgi:hypothetical protein
MSPHQRLSAPFASGRKSRRTRSGRVPALGSGTVVRWRRRRVMPCRPACSISLATRRRPTSATAVEAASPDLADRVGQICAGRLLPDHAVRRTVLSVLRYLLRARTRATPFGLLAGVEAARMGAAPALRMGGRHLVMARTGAAWTTALIEHGEEHVAELGELRAHLMLLANDSLLNATVTYGTEPFQYLQPPWTPARTRRRGRLLQDPRPRPPKAATRPPARPRPRRQPPLRRRRAHAPPGLHVRQRTRRPGPPLPRLHARPRPLHPGPGTPHDEGRAAPVHGTPCVGARVRPPDPRRPASTWGSGSWTHEAGTRPPGRAVVASAPRASLLQQGPVAVAAQDVRPGPHRPPAVSFGRTSGAVVCRMSAPSFTRSATRSR